MNDDLESYLLRKFAGALRRWAAFPDVYALSLYREDASVPYRPAAYLSYNRRSLVASLGDAADEAKWDYDLWPRRDLVGVERSLVPGNGWSDEPLGAAHLDHWIATTLGGSASAHDRSNLVPAFTCLCLRIARRLHEEGSIRAAFGRPLPIIMFDEEGGEAMVRNTEAANPSAALYNP